ncbi:RNA polymerase III RPC4-domain-containing protein [Fimicolochytrium jonesii]|uniref:RNA polymerase III RPC4-domain-containing protein n=1 Tax=Fimicolochytrium jonesii TaxID=1396493 RepID=UPI0022FE2226|nr:RNA polymerase III RPC4-domain-containing protein [Fimicolochytrium jonesii]KAI8824389.1 RNA polymerase III RPC4-domain-containing protein [Fimicolochytrium jonesii]
MTGRRKAPPRGQRAAAAPQGEAGAQAPGESSSTAENASTTPAAADTQRQFGTIDPAAGSSAAPGRLGSLRAPPDIRTGVATGGGAKVLKHNPSTDSPSLLRKSQQRGGKWKKLQHQRQARDHNSATAPGVEEVGDEDAVEEGEVQPFHEPAGPGGRQEVKMTASGPFAFGPAQRGIIATPGRASGPSAKHEVVDQKDAKAAEEDDNSFDPTDQWSPVVVGNVTRPKREKKLRATDRVKVKTEAGVEAQDGAGADVVPMDIPSTAEDVLDELADLGFKPYPHEQQMEEEEPDTTKVLFFQFPSILPKFQDTSAMVIGGDSAPVAPAKSAKRRPSKDDGAVKMEDGASGNVKPHQGPDGRAGRLVIYKSGKMKIRMGDILFDVTPGSQPGFLQQIVAVDTSQPACYILGKVAKRFVCTPDVESLLAADP